MAEELTIIINAENRATQAINNAMAKIRDLANTARSAMDSIRRTNLVSPFLGIIGVVSGAVSRVLGLLTGLISSILERILALLNRIKSAVLITSTALTTAITYSAVKLGAWIQGINIAFETMLGNAQAAKVFIAQLWELARVTPFTRREVVELAQRLLAYGFAVEQIPRLITDISDATSALGGGTELMNRIALAIGQIYTKGKLAGEEIRQLAEAGIPVKMILANALGVTTAQLEDLQEKGIDANTALSALLGYIETRYGGLSRRMMSTLSGAWSNLIDAVEGLLIRLGEKVAPKLASVVRAITTAIESLANSPAFEAIITRISLWLDPRRIMRVLGYIVGVTINVGRALANLFKVIPTNVVGNLMQLFTFIANIVDWSLEAAKRLGQFLAQVGRVVKDQWSAILTALAETLSVVADKVGVIIRLIVTAQALLIGLQIGAKKGVIGAIIGAIIGAAAGWFGQKLLGDLFKREFQDLKATVQSIWSGAQLPGFPTLPAWGEKTTIRDLFAPNYQLMNWFESLVPEVQDSTAALRDIAKATQVTAENTAPLRRLADVIGGGQAAQELIPRLAFGAPVAPRYVTVRIKADNKHDEEVAYAAIRQLADGIGVYTL